LFAHIEFEAEKIEGEDAEETDYDVEPEQAVPVLLYKNTLPNV
jgi:hypothetical protein